MILEPKHILPYFLHDLEGIFTDLPGGREFVLTGLVKEDEEGGDYWVVHGIPGQYGGHSSYIKNFKPILKPFSYLTEKIKIGREEFIPTDRITDEIGIEFDICMRTGHPFIKRPDGTSFCVYSAHNEIVSECPESLKQWLIKWHFDIQGLIDKGLAIDYFAKRD